ncbi:MAG: type II toxin-antitoxin system RelE/ParE family toxin [Proteobacteria bacterium]|nr:type II toxin-antitoxin system RelE/ParE family toxin [Pseudomonadota bacterium]
MYTFMIPDDVSELIRKMHPHLKKRIKASLKIILSDPSSGKVLKDELTGLQSYRVASFRIIYRLSGTIIELIAIGPRRQIYGETYKILIRTK